MSDRTLLAYVDETMSDSRKDPGTYVLAAGVCHPTELSQIRASMLGLKLRGQQKVHWRDESDKRKAAIIATVSALPLSHVVVIRDQMEGARPERRRRLCLERLLFELDRLDVQTVTFESRGPADDARDRDMVGALRARQVIAGGLRMEHEKGPREAALWVPDAVCGAITADRTGEHQYLAAISPSMEVIYL